MIYTGHITVKSRSRRNISSRVSRVRAMYRTGGWTSAALILSSETGGLFRMATKMMQAEATRNKTLNIDALMTLLGRYYQVRDDYYDVVSAGVS